jgi:hypothetical protein
LQLVHERERWLGLGAGGREVRGFDKPGRGTFSRRACRAYWPAGVAYEITLLFFWPWPGSSLWITRPVTSSILTSHCLPRALDFESEGSRTKRGVLWAIDCLLRLLLHYLPATRLRP